MSKDLGLGSLGNAAEKIRNLKSTSAKNEEVDGKQLVSVPVNLIDFDEEQVRKNRDDYDLEGLADSLYEVGLEQPPSFEPQEDGRFKVVIGEMRTRAWLLNHERFPDEERFNEIPAIRRDVKPLQGMSKRATLRVIQLTENLKRDDGDLFDIAENLVLLEEELGTEALKKYLADNNHPNNKVALSRWRSLRKVNETVKQDVRANDIRDKETIANLGRIEGKDKVAYRKLVQGYQDDTLTLSLSKSAQSVWQSVRDKKKTKKAAKPETPSTQTSPEEKPTPSAKPAVATKGVDIDAKDMRVEDGVLVIELTNGTSFKVNTPDDMSVTIERSEA